MQQLTARYSPEEIHEARDEIFRLQANLNKIEALYSRLHDTLNEQHANVEQIETSIDHTQAALEKGGIDLYQIVELRHRKDKRRYLFIAVIAAIACLALLIVINVLANVVEAFAEKFKVTQVRK